MLNNTVSSAFDCTEIKVVFFTPTLFWIRIRYKKYSSFKVLEGKLEKWHLNIKLFPRHSIQWTPFFNMACAKLCAWYLTPQLVRPKKSIEIALFESKFSETNYTTFFQSFYKSVNTGYYLWYLKIWWYFLCSRKTRWICNILWRLCSNLTIKSPKTRRWRSSGAFTCNIEYIQHIIHYITPDFLYIIMSMYLLDW